MKKSMKKKIDEFLAENSVSLEVFHSVRKVENINKLVGYYHPYLIKMGKIHWYYPVIINELELSRGAIQAAYKQIDVLRPQPTLLEYLCWISTMYLSHLWEQQNDLKKLDSQEAVKRLGTLMLAHREHGMNLMRLLMKDPSWFFLSNGYTRFGSFHKGGDKYSLTEPYLEFFNGLVTSVIIPFSIADNQTMLG